jgi:hypothetical protein
MQHSTRKIAIPFCHLPTANAPTLHLKTLRLLTLYEIVDPAPLIPKKRRFFGHLSIPVSNWIASRDLVCQRCENHRRPREPKLMLPLSLVS